jgi:hypothetical protein
MAERFTGGLEAKTEISRRLRQTRHAFKSAALYRLTSSEPKASAQPELSLSGPVLELDLPGLSITTVVLKP